MTTNDTRRTHAFTDEEVAQFERDGYIGPVKLYEEAEMVDRWKHIQRALRDRSHALYPDVILGKPIGIANYDRHLDIDLLSEHIMMPEIVDRLTSLLGPNVLCWRSEFFPKYQGDEGTDWHQAATFAHATGTPQIVWPSKDGEEAFVGTITVWTAFTHSTKTNGCLQLMPGTHTYMNYDETKGMTFDDENRGKHSDAGVTRGFFGYDYRQLQKDPNWKPDESQAFPMVLKPGECVFFWSNVMHASLPHTGTLKDYRMGYAARYVPAEVKVYPGIHALKEYGQDISLAEHGSVLVAGTDEYGHNDLATESRRGYRFVPR